MPLKTRQGTESVSNDPFAGPWGRIDYESIQTVRFQKTDRWKPVTYSYPYRSLSRWEYHKSYSSEEIMLQAVTDNQIIDWRGATTCILILFGLTGAENCWIQSLCPGRQRSDHRRHFD